MHSCDDLTLLRVSPVKYKEVQKRMRGDLMHPLLVT
jgi:hypothetical protein